MKSFVALALLAVLGFAATGCGAAKKVVIVTKPGPVVAGRPATAHAFAITGTMTIPDVTTGTRVTCKGWGRQGVRVPPRGEVVEGFASRFTIPGKKSPALDQMSLKHQRDGSITVTCKPSN